MGKAYAHRGEVIKKDLYHSPRCLTPLLLDKEKFKNVWEPACGLGAISDHLQEKDILMRASDIESGVDFLTAQISCKKTDIITNPPFFLWDDFVKRAKKDDCHKFAFIGRLNYLGTFERFNSGLFEGLKAVYPFTRYVDYQTPLRDDGLFHVGAMATAWFVWERGYKRKPAMEQLDVQEWAKLGNYDPWAYRIYKLLGIDTNWTPDMEIDSKELLLFLQDRLEFKFTQKELNSKCSSIGSVIRLLKKVNRDRSFEDLPSWSRV